MLKKIISVLLVVVLALSFTACAKAKEYPYGPVAGGASAGDKVENNGSFVVKKGDYIYFINSSELTTATNELGATTNGALMRANADGSNPTIILPKLVANTSGTGLYIFGDTIYFTSPCDEINSKGKVQNSYLDIMSVKLDGTNATKYATLGSTGYQMTFVEDNGEVYAIYVSNNEISSIKLDGNSKPQVISSEYTSCLFYNGGLIEATTENGATVVKKVSANGDKQELFNGNVNGRKYTYTLVREDNGKVFYRKTDSVVTLEDSLCMRELSNVATETKLLENYTGSFVPTSYPSDGIIASSATLGTVFVPFNGGEVKQLRSGTVSTLIRVDGKYLYYGTTSSNVLTVYRYSIDELMEGKGVALQFLVLSETTDEEGKVTTTYDTAYTSPFGTAAIGGNLYYYANVTTGAKVLKVYNGEAISLVGVLDSTSNAQ